MNADHASKQVPSSASIRMIRGKTMADQLVHSAFALERMVGFRLLSSGRKPLPHPMNNLFRNVLALIIGFAVGSLVNMGLVTLGPRVFPPPAGVNMTTAEGIAVAMPLLEPRHFVFPFLAHALGTLAGALVAFLMARSHRAAFAWAIGGLTLCGGVAASFMIPAPKWFVALDLLVAYLPMAWLATRLGARVTTKPATT